MHEEEPIDIPDESEIETELLQEFKDKLNTLILPEGCFITELVYSLEDYMISVKMDVLIPEANYKSVVEKIKTLLSDLSLDRITLSEPTEKIFGFIAVRIIGTYGGLI